MSSIYRARPWCRLSPAASTDSASIRLLERRRYRVDRERRDGRDLERPVLHRALPPCGQLAPIMFPETGRNIPFTIENYAFVDQFGRETVSWIRTFESRRTRRFDAYMIYSDARRRIVDYLGSHEHLAVDIDLSVDEAGGLRLRSGAQRFYEGVIGFNFPMLFSGIADVREWYDDDAQMLPNRRRRAQQRLGTAVWLPRQLQRRMAEGDGQSPVTSSRSVRNVATRTGHECDSRAAQRRVLRHQSCCWAHSPLRERVIP